MVDDVQLSEKAAQVARSMLDRRHPTGEFVYQTVAEITGRLAPALPRGSVAQIVKRLSGHDWLESYQEAGGGDRLWRFTAEGADAARAALGHTSHTPSHTPSRRAPSHAPRPVAARAGGTTSMAEIEATESPATVALIRRELGWDDTNQPARTRRRG